MILIFGGTTEGRIAAQTLDSAGTPFYYSTKGDLQDIQLCNGERVCGAMNSAEMEKFCLCNEIKLIIDAAHPFAVQLHNTIYAVSQNIDIKVIRFERTFEERSNKIIWCNTFEEASDRIYTDGIRSLLALTGVNTISRLKSYWNKKECKCLFRVLDRDESRFKAHEAGFSEHNLLYFNEELLNASKNDSYNIAYKTEYDILKTISPEAIITKESGTSGYFKEKVKASQDLGIKVYAVKRPQLPKSFISVYGPVGLRLEVEKYIPDFFPLRIGLTTGSTATAAVKAAIKKLLYDQTVSDVMISLPSGENVKMPVKDVWGDGNKAFACVTKYSGDDPDVTNGHDIICAIEKNNTGNVIFFGGEGVGVVTLPGLGLEVGGPAINNGPRKMITEAISQESEILGYNVTISVCGGEELASRTFNPRVGVVGGISIIGTSGVVRPFSKDAFLSSISKEMDVAIAMGITHLVINSGAKSEQQLKKLVDSQLPPQAFVHYGNFIGDTIRMANEHGFSSLTMGIMIGKAVKLAAGNMDTHSKVVTVDKKFVQDVAREYGCDTIPQNFTLARELWKMFDEEDSIKFFSGIRELCYKHCKPLFPNGKLEILLVKE